MAKKKKISVLDYDPLAWLNESDVEEPKPASKARKASAKKTSPKKAVKKTAKKAVKTKVNKAEVDQRSTEEDGFGFFAETVEIPTEVNTESENDTSEDSESDEGFGLFKDDHNSPDLDANTDDEGFGFFTDDENDVLEAENMETLNISKDDAINLGSELTIKTVLDVKNKISGLLTNDVDIVINAEEMIKIDTAGLQLLYSLKEALGETGHHIKWVGTSTVINDSAAIIGMPVLAPKTKEACFGFFEENMPPKDAEDGSSGFF